MTMPSQKSVVIHADDLGMCHGANTAYIDLVRRGVCSSGSVMVPCPWFLEVAEMAASDGRLDIGVHLTLTSEKKHYKWRPLTASPPSAGMTDGNGLLFPDVATLRAAAEPEAVETELRAQIEAAFSAGIDVTHLDDHAGAVLAPEFCDIYVRLGLEYELPVVMTPSLATYGGIHNLEGVADADYQRHAAQARVLGFRMFDRILETPWLRSVPADRAYREMIGLIAPGYSFMALHFNAPGEIEFIEPESSHIRTEEYELFRSGEFGEWLDSQGINVIGMRELRDELRSRWCAERGEQ